MTDYKALCARMADELDHYRQLLMDDRRETHALATEARAALAQPEPETDDSLTNYPKVTRVEVITSKGREFVQHECAHVRFSLQDDGRTIKVFLSSND
jgi:hypothetical protein